jgi:hypothetical protein
MTDEYTIRIWTDKYLLASFLTYVFYLNCTFLLFLSFNERMKRLYPQCKTKIHFGNFKKRIPFSGPFFIYIVFLHLSLVVFNS